MPSFPEGSVVEAILSEPVIVIDVAADAVCAGLVESFTVTVKLALVLAFGVPEITPVEAAIVRPLGNAPDDTDQMYGAFPPAAVRPAL